MLGISTVAVLISNCRPFIFVVHLLCEDLLRRAGLVTEIIQGAPRTWPT